MQNFNTNQTRHFYVAKQINANVGLDRNAADSAAADNLDIAMKQIATGELFFSYKNADGLVTRSDTIDPKKITSLKLTKAADMDLPILGIKLEAASGILGDGLTGKTLSTMVTVHQMFDYDESNSLTYVASLVGNSTNLASTNSYTAFYKAMALELAKVLPADIVKVYCGATEVTKKTQASDIANNPTAIYLIPKVQKYVRGKLSAETATLSVASRIHDGEDTAWLADTVKPQPVSAINTADTLSLTPTAIASVYNLADLEYFALGERGDVYRMFNYPFNYDPTYAIDLSKTYDVLTIEYYWAGNVENVQKSPRMIQIACEVSTGDSIADELYDAVAAAMAGIASS